MRKRDPSPGEAAGTRDAGKRRKGGTISRRAFVKSVTLAGAGITIFGGFPPARAASSPAAELQLQKKISAGQHVRLDARSSWLEVHSVRLLRGPRRISRFEVAYEFTDRAAAGATFQLKLEDTAGTALFEGTSFRAQSAPVGAMVSHGHVIKPGPIQVHDIPLGSLDISKVSRFKLEISRK